MTASFTLSKTAGTIVEEALRDARIIPNEQPVQNVDYQNGLTAMNNVLKWWQTQGIHLWRIKRAVLPLTTGTKYYSLGPTGDKCGEEDSFYQTTLSAAEASGQTTLSVSSTTGMAASSQIGIELDDGTMQWTTISSVGSGEVTVAAALTGNAASGNTVFHYVTQIQRPLSIYNQTYSATFSGSEIPVDIWSRSDYMEQPQKSDTGTVTGAHYQPLTTNGRVYVWQTASNVKSVLRFDYREPLKVYDAVADTLEVPEEYYLPLKWAIAAEVGPQYGLPDNRQKILESKATTTLEEALDNDAEDGSLFIAPDIY
jgi:hypothetical protein